jgi:hypothetical protein
LSREDRRGSVYVVTLVVSILLSVLADGFDLDLGLDTALGATGGERIRCAMLRCRVP